MEMSTVWLIIEFLAVWGVPEKHGFPKDHGMAEKEAHLEILLHVPQAMKVDKESLKTTGAANKKELDASFGQFVSEMRLNWKVDDGQLVVVGVYVDDLLAAGTDTAAIESFFNHLKSLSIKELGVVSTFLAVRVAMDNAADTCLARRKR
uniref:Reverse transcriptase Ty1/copia-type domain-containing protein n=1 Tax=Peronospora matthiolae TaxID=2874970 RepID=A0AAV1TRZ6_9STRA